MKRLIDFLLALFAMIVLAPLFLVIMAILRFSGEGEEFYLQERIGKDGKPFNVMKFATMLKNSPNIGTGTITLQHDPRVLPVGRFLRKTKINELPQIINVLRGDIAIVGPRPQTQECFDFFPDELKDKIASLRPGITGIGSVVFRDEEAIMGDAAEDRDKLYTAIMAYKGELEVWYGEKKSLLLDFKLIFATALAIIMPSLDVAKMFKGMPEMPADLGSIK